MSAVAALLPDGRLHLQHGPIDCLCRAWGEREEVRAAYARAAYRFATVLDELCAELRLLRAPLPARRPEGAIARAMHEACMPFAERFITPMAAVAGAVADAVLAAMLVADLDRAFVNNGGDIAFHLRQGESLRCALVTDIAARSAEPARLVPVASPALPSSSWPGSPLSSAAGLPPSSWPGSPLSSAAGTLDGTISPSPDGTFVLTAAHPARGIATSGRACKGRGGKSFSFGIADSVTVLARTAAMADAAATIIGNAVDLPGHPAIDRRPACEIDPASDLGDRLITFDLGLLPAREIGAALDAGANAADALLADGLIDGAALLLRGQMRVLLPSPALLEPA